MLQPGYAIIRQTGFGNKCARSGRVIFAGQFLRSGPALPAQSHVSGHLSGISSWMAHCHFKLNMPKNELSIPPSPHPSHSSALHHCHIHYKPSRTYTCNEGYLHRTPRSYIRAARKSLLTTPPFSLCPQDRFRAVKRHRSSFPSQSLYQHIAYRNKHEQRSPPSESSSDIPERDKKELMKQ